MLDISVIRSLLDSYFCSDFRYESNGKFVLRWVFFLQTNFDFLTKSFLAEFFYIIWKVLLSWAQIWKDITPVIIFRKVTGV